MKKLIDSKLYDTDSAQLITSVYPNGTRDRSDFQFLKERLFQTKSGRYFIAGEGGPRTSYRQPAPAGGMTGGEDIRAVTEAEAYEWCQEHGAVDAALEHFEDYIEIA